MPSGRSSEKRKELPDSFPILFDTVRSARLPLSFFKADKHYAVACTNPKATPNNVYSQNKNNISYNRNSTNLLLPERILFMFILFMLI